MEPKDYWLDYQDFTYTDIKPPPNERYRYIHVREVTKEQEQKDLWDYLKKNSKPNGYPSEDELKEDMQRIINDFYK